MSEYANVTFHICCILESPHVKILREPAVVAQTSKLRHLEVSVTQKV